LGFLQRLAVLGRHRVGVVGDTVDQRLGLGRGTIGALGDVDDALQIGTWSFGRLRPRSRRCGQQQAERDHDGSDHCVSPNTLHANHSSCWGRCADHGGARPFRFPSWTAVLHWQ
jgi:hypothetical protein